MSLTTQLFPRPTEPDLNVLNAAISAFLPAANGAFLTSWDGSNIVIAYGNWTGVDTNSIQAQVTACVVRTYRTDAKTYIDNMDVPLKAAFLVILDEVNIIRTKTGSLPIGASRTQAQFFQAIKDKIDTL